ncbi:MAG: M50 family metallopeptidase [Lachnospiraceae bacterium]|nr:M50 family metallopeptidase [Lachnospiraceae bacterium]
MSIVIAIIIFSIIILFHELGHFLLAKANGIRVNEFSLGLGPTLVGFTKGETKYSIKLLPFGGACMMEGEDNESEDSRAFNNKSVLGRISVVAAGPIFNFIMAFTFAVVVVAILGFGKCEVGSVKPGYSAAEAGIQEGDEIIRLGNKRIHLFKELAFYTYVHQDEDIDVTLLRDGKEKTVTLKPTYDKKEKRYVIGITGAGYEKGNALQVLKYGFYDVKYYIDTTLTSLKLLITGGVSLNDLSGPVGIVSTIGDAYNDAKPGGALLVFLNLSVMVILLSANLGVMNLLPIPALDGGRLVFLIVEAIRGKKMNPDKEGMIHFVGLLILLALMVVVMFNDFRKFFV